MLSREATGLRHISVYWDWEEGYWHRVCRERFAICVCIREDPRGCRKWLLVGFLRNDGQNIWKRNWEYRYETRRITVSSSCKYCENINEQLLRRSPHPFFVPFLRIRTHCSAYSTMSQLPKLPEERHRLYEFGFLPCTCWCIEKKPQASPPPCSLLALFMD
jgi:hypothetical protein